MSRGWYLGSTVLSITDNMSSICQLTSRPQPSYLVCSWLLPLGALEPLVSLCLSHHPTFLNPARILWIELAVLWGPYSTNPSGTHLCLTLSEMFASWSHLSALLMKHSWPALAFLSLQDRLSRAAGRQLCFKAHLCFDVGYVRIKALLCVWCEIKKKKEKEEGM